MTMYRKLKKIAKPVVKAYMTDLTKHDRTMLRTFKTGNTAVWVARQHGTQLIPIRTRHADHASLEALRNRLNWFDAIVDAYDWDENVGKWYLLESTNDQHGHVFQIDVKQARKIFVQHIEAIEYHLRNQTRHAA